VHLNLQLGFTDCTLSQSSGRRHLRSRTLRSRRWCLRFQAQAAYGRCGSVVQKLHCTAKEPPSTLVRKGVCGPPCCCTFRMKPLDRISKRNVDLSEVRADPGWSTRFSLLPH